VFCFVSSEHGSAKVVRFVNLHLTRSQTCQLSCHNFTLLQADAHTKSNKMPHLRLKGSRKLYEFPLTTFGTSNGGGTAGGIGSVTNGDALGVSNAIGTGTFDTTSGSSGFIDTALGSALGMSAGGATGSQIGGATANTGIGTISFDGLTSANGGGGFGAGVNPVQFNPVTSTIPGVGVSGGSKKGGAFSAPTTVTNFVPSLTGPTGGFGFGNGNLDITSGSTGTLNMGTIPGTGSSVGTASNFGGGSGSGTNLFGTAGGLGSGAGTGGATGAGSTNLDGTNGIFTGLGTSTGNFANQGSGLFGASGSLSFLPP
jgi:hypothetical protein